MNCHIPDYVLNVALAHLFQDLCRHLIVFRLLFLWLFTVIDVGVLFFCINFALLLLLSLNLYFLLVTSNWRSVFEFLLIFAMVVSDAVLVLRQGWVF